MACFENEGFCFCSENKVRFVAYSENFRSTYRCKNCGSAPRERALVRSMNMYAPNWKNLVIHESSPGNAASKFIQNECKKYIASQYYPDIPSGKMHNETLCENIENLSFENDSIDIHVTQDVLEHVFFPGKAFQEIARTLRPGGMHIFTVPLVLKNNPSRQCAFLSKDGFVNIEGEPRYHGSPVSSDGSLVTWDWGYDICDHIALASGLFSTIIYIDAIDYGIRADLIEVIVTRKPLVCLNV